MPIGKIIALLAEEGDDISNLQIPKDDVAPPPPKEAETSPSVRSPTPNSDRLFTSEPQPPQSAEGHGSPEHSRPLFPSVHRLLVENGITDAAKIKGTGVRGMLTKGDVLAFLGHASSPLGTFKFGPSPIQEANASKTQGQKPAAPAKVHILNSTRDVHTHRVLYVIDSIGWPCYSPSRRDVDAPSISEGAQPRPSEYVFIQNATHVRDMY